MLVPMKSVYSLTHSLDQLVYILGGNHRTIYIYSLCSNAYTQIVLVLNIQIEVRPSVHTRIAQPNHSLGRHCPYKLFEVFSSPIAQLAATNCTRLRRRRRRRRRRSDDRLTNVREEDASLACCMYLFLSTVGRVILESRSGGFFNGIPGTLKLLCRILVACLVCMHIRFKRWKLMIRQISSGGRRHRAIHTYEYVTRG